MRVRVANKGRFFFWCFIFILIVLYLFFSLGKHIVSSYVDKSVDSKPNDLQKSIVLTSDKNGSISLEENDYYKKFIINTKNYNNNVDYEELKDSIEVNLKKDDISKLNLKGNKEEVNDVFYENSGDNLKIVFKKSFDENNFVYIDKDSTKKIIVLISKMKNPYHHTIALDAGHGGEDIGANVGQTYEKDITLKIADYTAEELRYKGYKVIRTREDDRLIPLAEIGEIANAASADLFVSVHINFNKESIYKGVCTYYYAKNGYQKEERAKLAQTIQAELVKDDNWEDRGILSENFQVLRDTQMPSVLLECGFLSNSEDRRKLADNKVLKNFAKNITNGIDKYLAVSKSEE